MPDLQALPLLSNPFPLPPHGEDAGADAPFQIILTADSHAIRAALIRLKGHFSARIGADAMGRLELVMAEVLNNISEHACDQDSARTQIHLGAFFLPEGIVCAVTDSGTPLPAHCLTIGRDANETARAYARGLPEGGFGWRLIQDLTESITYFRRSNRNFLSLTVPHYDVAQQRHCA